MKWEIDNGKIKGMSDWLLVASVMPLVINNFLQISISPSPPYWVGDDARRLFCTSASALFCQIRRYLFPFPLWGQLSEGLN
jgi:hypothetical protein